jgi:tetratricopeptide (TPR) repeat protein
VFLAAVTALAQTSDYDRGVALFQKGDYAAAIPFLTRAAEAHSQNAQAWKALGAAHAAGGQYHQAEPAFRKACQLDAKLPDACYYEGRALYALDRYQPSLEVLERVAQSEPGSWKVRLGIAQALEALGRAGAAEKEFQQALSLARQSDPQPGVAWGRFLVRQGRFDEAIAPLEEVLKRFPSSAEAHVQLGRALLEQVKLAEAIPHLERAVAIDPRSAQGHLLLANAYVRAGRAAEAQPHFEAAARNEETSRTLR